MQLEAENAEECSIPRKAANIPLKNTTLVYMYIVYCCLVFLVAGLKCHVHHVHVHVVVKSQIAGYYTFRE